MLIYCAVSYRAFRLFVVGIALWSHFDMMRLCYICLHVTIRICSLHSPPIQRLLLSDGLPFISFNINIREAL